MKKVVSILCLFVLLLSLASCVAKVTEFTHEGVTYYYEFVDGRKSIANYNPNKLSNLPKYQELIQLGDGVGDKNEGRVYYIFILDMTFDTNDPKAYYTAEFDAETRELLSEEGEYFATEADKNATVTRLFHLIDTVSFE